MSDDQNSNDIEETAEAVKEAVEGAVETVKETVEEAVDVVKDAVEDVVEDNSSAISKVMELKESNPKVFFGAIAGLVVVILFMFMGGGSNATIQKHKQVNLSVGNSYTLKAINTYSDDVKVRLVAVPGSMAAYDDSKAEDGSNDACKHIPQGTKVKLLNTQEAFGGATFVELEILGSGKCAGRTGWASASNLN